MDLLKISNKRRWTIVGLLFTASLINYLDRAAISIALPLISRDFHLTPETKGMLLSSFFWSYALMQIPIGWCADRFNLRWLYAGAFALWSLAQGLTGLAGSLAALIGFRILLGVGESIYLPGGTKIVSLLFTRKDRGLPSGLFDFGTRTGLVLEGFLVPWLLVRHGWRHTFLLLGFAALVWMVPWFWIFPRRTQPVNKAGASPPTGMLSPIRGATFLNRNLLGICLGFFCFDYYWYVLVTWLPDYLVTVRHLSIVQAGFYASLVFFTFGVAEPIGGWIADNLIRQGWDETRTRKGIVTGAFFMGLLLIVAMRASDTRMAIELLIAASLVGLSTGNLLAILQCCAPLQKVGIWTGAENFAGNLAGIIAPLVVGLLIRRSGSYVPGFELGSIVLLVGLLAYWFVVGELKPASS
ncbi:MAG TPA: MFS transporter [Candidatus Dormibacteraeota bacterium]|nr:MFS transporter [Candidatus Dormibacteraeota bacterium]